MMGVSNSTRTRSSARSARWRSAARTISLRAVTAAAKRWAIVCSLIETCKLNGVEPYAYSAQTKRQHRANRQDENHVAIFQPTRMENAIAAPRRPFNDDGVDTRTQRSPQDRCLRSSRTTVSGQLTATGERLCNGHEIVS